MYSVWIESQDKLFWKVDVVFADNRRIVYTFKDFSAARQFALNQSVSS